MKSKKKTYRENLSGNGDHFVVLSGNIVDFKNNLQVREYSKRIDMSTHVIERLTALIADKQKEVLL